MADHPLTLKLFYDGIYNDVSTDVSQNDPVAVQHGGAEVSDAPRPSTVSFTFEDTAGKYRPYLPTSALYGKAGRNTPMQITDGGFFEVASWKPDQTVGFNQGPPTRGRRWTETLGAGPLMRVGGWTEPIKSAMTRKLLTMNLVDLWTLEDPRDGQQISNPYGTDALFNNNGLGDQESPAGGSTSYKLNGNARVTGLWNPNGPVDAWQIAFCFKLPKLPSSSYVALMSIAVGNDADTGQIWTVFANDARYRLTIFQSQGLTGTVIVDSTAVYSGASPDKWVGIRLQGSTSAGTLSWGLGWMTEGSTAPIGIAGSIAEDFFDKPSDWSIAASPGDELDGSSWAYVYSCQGLLPDLAGTSVGAAFGGYRGETTGARFLRLCTEEGLTATVEGTSDEAMGAQRPDTFIELLKEIRDTDGGLLVDDRTQLGLYLRSRKSIYSQAVDLALTFGNNVGPPLKPILDNLNTHNLVTVNNRSGGTVAAQDSTSAMGSANPPAGVGKQKQDIDVNVLLASRLNDIAAWWLRIGTVPDVRYSSVTVDLDANPSLEATAVAIKAGDRITIASLDPDVIDLLVIGTLDRRDDQKRRKVTFTCVPYRQYDIAIYQVDGATPTAAMKRYDSRTSVTNTTLNTTVGTIVVKFTDIRDAWSTTSVPYDWAIAGERVRVTAMGAITGSGPWTQSATVTRSINNVIKSHLAGEQISMHPDQQARYAL